MCLYPKIIKNPRFTENKKNKGCVPICTDYRKLYIPVGCGECFECRKQKAQQWRVRLMEEIKVQKYKYFVTLTFSPSSLSQLKNEVDGEKLNAIATLAVRRFLERYRKRYGKSCKHWLITELGQDESERIHLHGILMPEQEMTIEELNELWKYGKSDNGKYVNERTINYIIKYVTKIDAKHKTYKPIILCSAGLGASYTNSIAAKMKYRYRKGQTPEDYEFNNGRKTALPIYYRNKFYTEEERNKMWTDRLDKGEIYVNGIKIRNIDSEESQKAYARILTSMQEWNESIGFGNRSKEWQKEEYNVTFKMLQQGRKKIVNTEN